MEEANIFPSETTDGCRMRARGWSEAGLQAYGHLLGCLQRGDAGSVSPEVVAALLAVCQSRTPAADDAALLLALWQTARRVAQSPP